MRVAHLCVLTFNFLIVGCAVQRDYTWIQQDDGAGAKAPIQHELHVRVDVDHNRLAIVEDVTDANGKSDRRFTEYGETQLSACQIVDVRNWRCEQFGLDNDGHVVVSVDMNDGHLSRNYWGTVENFRTHYSVLGARK